MSSVQASVVSYFPFTGVGRSGSDGCLIALNRGLSLQQGIVQTSAQGQSKARMPTETRLAGKLRGLDLPCEYRCTDLLRFCGSSVKSTVRISYQNLRDLR